MKTPNTNPKPEEVLTLWVKENIKQIEYGEITLTVHIHQGRVVASEKKVTLKENYSSK